eukprot:5981677-Amphidinium_carterae.1
MPPKVVAIASARLVRKRGNVEQSLERFEAKCNHVTSLVLLNSEISLALCKHTAALAYSTAPRRGIV